MNQSTAGQLPRRLSLATAVATVVGVTIGSGIFRVPAEVAQEASRAFTAADQYIAAKMYADTSKPAFDSLKKAFIYGSPPGTP